MAVFGTILGYTGLFYYNSYKGWNVVKKQVNMSQRVGIRLESNQY